MSSSGKPLDVGYTRMQFQRLESHYYHPVFGATGASVDAKIEDVAFQCVKCRAIEPLRPCPNCDSPGFVPGVGGSRATGIFCHRCSKGFSSWTCSACGCENAVPSSIGQMSRTSDANSNAGSVGAIVFVVVSFVVMIIAATVGDCV